jgi:hypothetical protein
MRALSPTRPGAISGALPHGLNGIRLLRGGATDGERYAARQIVFELHPVSDPDVGTIPAGDSLWGAFIAALRGLDAADPELAEYRALADLIEAEIVEPQGIGSWQIAAARLGLARQSARALGIAGGGWHVGRRGSALVAVVGMDHGGGDCRS